jgi:hypothetical protein
MTTRERIFRILGSDPNDLAALYEGDQLPIYPESRVNVQPFAQAEKYTSGMAGISIVDRLGLWFLDDANDSNPYAYISRGPCSGMVIHFSHDDEPRISFGSLARFVQAMHELGSSGRDIDDLSPDEISAPLAEPIRALASEDSEDATYLICAYLPICSALDEQTEEALLASDDFFIREALAMYLAEKPSSSRTRLATLLANDRHPQVADAGKKALAAVRKNERG